MKLDSEQVLQNRARPSRRDAPASGWPRTCVLLAAAMVGILTIYRETAASIVGLWSSSETFMHGYAIVPIVLFLVWGKRSVLADIAPRHDYLGFVLLAIAGCGWLVASAAQVQVVQQYAMTAMIPATVVALAGRRAAMAIAFPLAFLLLGVPFGEAFLPRMMDWTAEFAVGALRQDAWSWWVGLAAALLNGLLVVNTMVQGASVALSLVWAVVPVVLVSYLVAPAGRRALGGQAGR